MGQSAGSLFVFNSDKHEYNFVFSLRRWSWFTAVGKFTPEKKSLFSIEPTQGTAVAATLLKVQRNMRS